MPRRQVYFSDEQEAQLAVLGIPNLSAYVRAKMEEDARQGLTMAGMKEDLERRRAELRDLESAFEGRALVQEQALMAVGEAAETFRKTPALDPRASVQTSLVWWIRNNPKGQKLRDVLPSTVSDAEIADILLKWPESRAQVKILVEGASR